MKKIIASAIAAVAMTAAVPGVAFAHVVVTPNQASIGDRVLFTISVPNEKEIAVSSIKLVIPSGLQDVQPDVTAGWALATTTDKNNNVSSITWTGNIPAGQRADLEFKAQVPARAGELDWKAYQTYADDTVVSWDQKPNQAEDSGNAGPYSVTSVVNDLNASTTNGDDSSKTTLAYAFSIAALALSISALFLSRGHRARS